MILRTLIPILAMFAAPAAAQERVHADLPLFDDPKRYMMYPEGFVEGDDFGCRSPVPFGDWQFISVEDGQSDVHWLRLRNYGVFHCGYIEYWADDRQSIEKANYEYSWLIKVGATKRNGVPYELWALQTGMKSGADYLLLGRSVVPNKLIQQFDVLPVDCPRWAKRATKTAGYWRTAYCAINSAAEMKAFARKMAMRPPAGTLTWKADAPERQD